MSSTRSGLAFERATAQALRDLGWDASTTSSTGDFGADVLARIGRTSLVVQCKDWASPAGFDAVKEVIYARLHYKAAVALVVSRSGFTRQATEAAKQHDVTLLSLDDLKPGCAFDRILDARKLAAGQEERRLRVQAKELERQLANAAKARELQARWDMEERAKRLRENEARIAREAELRDIFRNNYYRELAKHKELKAISRARVKIGLPLFVVAILILTRIFIDKDGSGDAVSYAVILLFSSIFILPFLGFLLPEIPPEPVPPKH